MLSFWRAVGYSRTDDSAPSALFGRQKPDLQRHKDFDVRHMGDDSDEFPPALQRLDLRKHVGESILVKGSEPLVQKERIDLEIFTGHARECERERHAHEETLSAGKVFDRPDIVALIVIDHIEIERRILDADQFIPVAELAEHLIGL